MNFLAFRCFNCQQSLAIDHHGFCSQCYKKIKKHPYCGCCGSKLLNYHNGCGKCLSLKYKWHNIIQVSEYSPLLAGWIHQFKFHKAYHFDQALARLLLLAVKNAQRELSLSLPEVIMPVPLHWQRYWSRGYNQSELISVHLSRLLNIPLDIDSLSRIRATPPQRELSAKERKKNLAQAFKYQPQKHYKRVAIIDDVVTTGSTMNAICRELLKNEVEEIQVWTLARA
ncbi:phosphoribosyltransferase family protein [Otariodibacter oris]|uniref:ComF family protein n=1 Tax=Otariodibacter oris TaxID=1032623 RepID=A0A420XGY9_9PAST|nr:phosphoribosyltransferase family protein [Otariodibacter oris]QGM81144.1 amidophosphoribosyltransferase [Otariodibacter oris]RKR72697.1 ComF family protein [Otariodibacter oris]